MWGCELTNWFEINVSNNIKKVLEEFCESEKIEIEIANCLLAEDFSKLLDKDYLFEKYGNIDTNKLYEIISGVYLQSRRAKYGNENFWELAKKEREQAYNGEWHNYIYKLICNYVSLHSAVLFVGVANGYEIPKSEDFDFYALEEIDSSLENFRCENIKKKVLGSFENENIIINGKNGIDLIVALRCVLAKSNVQKFFNFARNNLRENGTVIISQPLKYLDAETFKKVENIEKRLEIFEKQLKILEKTQKIEVMNVFESEIEKFYIIKLAGEN